MLKIQTKGIANFHLVLNATVVIMAKIAVVKSQRPTVVKNRSESRHRIAPLP